jgi:hypothetical protein
MARVARETDWPALVADFRRSGLTQAAFCRSRRLSLHAFRYWLYRLRPRTVVPPAASTPQPTPSNPASATRFLPVHIRPEPDDTTHRPTPSLDPAPLELVLGAHRRVRVPVGFDPGTLRQLLDILEERP